MARIRTIKPEFWDSPGTARASLRARLFFIALWNWADDWGVGTANPKQLVGFAFPNDEDVTAADFPRLRTEVATHYGVQWYTVEDRPYYAIPSWDMHQKNERRANRRNPTPDQGILEDAEIRGTSVQTHGESPLGTGEQGNRGTGEQKSSAHPSDAPGARELDDMFDAFWSSWPVKKGKEPARKAFIKAIKAGADPDAISAGVEAYKRELGPLMGGKTVDGRTPKYAQGWLTDKRWEDEPASASVDQINAQWNAAMGEVRSDPCAGGHKWVSDGSCVRCPAIRGEGGEV